MGIFMDWVRRGIIPNSGNIEDDKPPGTIDSHGERVGVNTPREPMNEAVKEAINAKIS